MAHSKNCAEARWEKFAVVVQVYEKFLILGKSIILGFSSFFMSPLYVDLIQHISIFSPHF